jgi:hypothetical protein
MPAHIRQERVAKMTPAIHPPRPAARNAKATWKARRAHAMALAAALAVQSDSAAGGIAPPQLPTDGVLLLRAHACVPCAWPQARRGSARLQAWQWRPSSRAPRPSGQGLPEQEGGGDRGAILVPVHTVCCDHSAKGKSRAESRSTQYLQGCVE